MMRRPAPAAGLRAPYIYRTRDMGKTWQQPITRGLLPAGVYVHPDWAAKTPSNDRGCSSLEPSAVHSCRSMMARIGSRCSSTCRRHQCATSSCTATISSWPRTAAASRVIDDMSPLRQVTDAVLAADAYLFKPADAINYSRGGDNGTPLQKDEPQAPNPLDGAAIDYYLKSAATGAVTLEIVDAAGTVAQTFTAPSEQIPWPRAVAGGRTRRSWWHPQHVAALAHNAGAVLVSRRDPSRRMGTGRRWWTRRRWRWRRSWRTGWRRRRAGCRDERNVHCEADREWTQLFADVHHPSRPARQGEVNLGT